TGSFNSTTMPPARRSCDIRNSPGFFLRNSPQLSKQLSTAYSGDGSEPTRYENQTTVKSKSPIARLGRSTATCRAANSRFRPHRIAGQKVSPPDFRSASALPMGFDQLPRLRRLLVLQPLRVSIGASGRSEYATHIARCRSLFPEPLGVLPS